MARAPRRDRAYLETGGIFEVARRWFIGGDRSKWTGFNAYLRSAFGLSSADAGRLAKAGRQGVQAAEGVGMHGEPGHTVDQANVPLVPGVGPGPSPLDRVRYRVTTTYNRASDNTVQTRTVNVFFDSLATNEEIQAAAVEELLKFGVQTQGTPLFDQERDEILDVVALWIAAFRPLP